MAVFTQELNDTMLEASKKFLNGPYYGGDIVVPFWDYNDLATASTPISLLADTLTAITNDAAGPNTYLEAGEPTLGDVWNTDDQSFDFSQFLDNSMVDIRLDLSITTSSPNQNVNVDLHVGDGTASEFTIPFITSTFRDAGAHRLIRFNTIYLRDEIKSLPTRFKITTDDPATLKVEGWLVRTFIKA